MVRFGSFINAVFAAILFKCCICSKVRFSLAAFLSVLYVMVRYFTQRRGMLRCESVINAASAATFVKYNVRENGSASIAQW